MKIKQTALLKVNILKCDSVFDFGIDKLELGFQNPALGFRQNIKLGAIVVDSDRSLLSVLDGSLKSLFSGLHGRVLPSPFRYGIAQIQYDPTFLLIKDGRFPTNGQFCISDGRITSAKSDWPFDLDSELEFMIPECT